jgi:hypothetical protein
MATIAETNRSARLRQAALLGLGLIAVAAVAATAVLWGYFGTAVFFDMVVAGIAYCF